jgi:low temperature requirement protein LtrA
MVGWIGLLVVPASARGVGFLVMVVAELLVPVWAERPAPTPWHPHHIAERYGLFTLIVLGETVAAATVAIQSALDAGETIGALAVVAVGGLLIVFSMWWLYFSQPADAVVDHARASFEDMAASESFVWGYGHYVVFGSAAAVGASLAVVVDTVTHHAVLSERGAVLAVAIPVALFVLSVWVLHHRGERHTQVADVAYPVTAAVVLGLALAGASVLLVGLASAALAGITTVGRYSPD